MSAEAARELAVVLQGRSSGYLRSIVYYEADGYGVLFLRDDVEAEYDEDELDRAFEDARLEALSKPYQEDLYTHGELNCVVRCFEEGVEMQFAITRTAGVAVAFDKGVLTEQRSVVGECLSVLREG